jgi:RNA polymerase sigma factor (sigma-70 family)
MVQDRALAEDLAQDAFARAFASLASYDRQHKFSSWFFQILHNVTVDYLRRKRVKTSSLDEMEAAGVPLAPVAREAGPDARAEQAALGIALDEAMARLRPEYREVVVLRYREDLPVQDIAGDRSAEGTRRDNAAGAAAVLSRGVPHHDGQRRAGHAPCRQPRDAGESAPDAAALFRLDHHVGRGPSRRGHARRCGRGDIHVPGPPRRYAPTGRSAEV